MVENQARRRARRQRRGLLRAGEVLRAGEMLRAGGTLFAEVGYDKTTTNMIAERAGVSPGSLYQFFPHKEAIAQRIFVALLPLALASAGEPQRAIVRELKTVLCRYWAPLIAASGAADLFVHQAHAPQELPPPVRTGGG